MLNPSSSPLRSVPREPVPWPWVFRLLAVSLVAAVGGGCSKPSSGDVSPASPPGESRAEVTCQADPDEAVSSACSAVTVLSASGRRPTRVRIDERVWFGKDGTLMRAETRVRDESGAPEVRVLLDRRSGLGSLERGDRRAEWTMPTAEPWAYAPIIGPGGDPLPTALGAWSMARAARSSEWVRLVQAHEQKSHLVPRDQLVVDVAGSAAVVMGDDVAELDPTFVTGVRMGRVGVQFARTAQDGGTFTFVANECDAAAVCVTRPRSKTGGG